MEIRKNENSFEISLFWDDLSETAQNTLIELLGENGNWDIIPISIININKD